MGNVILICGKICSGKSYYASIIRETTNAVILSTDELTFDLIQNIQGEIYDALVPRVQLYLRKKAVEIAKTGATVILDWGFWTRESRMEMTRFLKSNNVPYTWHFMDIDDDLWYENIAQRNHRIMGGNSGSDFFLHEELLEKLTSLFEFPDRSEIDVWHNLH